MGYRYPRESKHTLCVRRGVSGLGVFSNNDIVRGDFIVEYFGTIVTDERADEVGGKYLFRLDGGKTILGNCKENLARFLNHSCRPNCEAEMDGKRIFIYAKRAIKAGEELVYHYGKEYWEEHIGPKKCRCTPCCS